MEVERRGLLLPGVVLEDIFDKEPSLAPLVRQIAYSIWLLTLVKWIVSQQSYALIIEKTDIMLFPSVLRDGLSV